MSDGSEGAGRGGLRVTFAGLTTRGRSFLAAGVAAAVCAYLLGQADLLRVGLLLAALPLVCVLVLHRTRHHVAAHRTLAPARVPVGAEARVRLSVENLSRLPTSVLMLQDRVPYVLGPRPRFVLDRVEAGGHREVSYRVRSDLRGRFPLGPLELRWADPFGMCELACAFGASDTLTAVPRTEPLPPVRMAGETAGFGDGRRRSAALAGEDDVIPRGYRHGDDLRRVHWRSTARHGELMVRREEQPRRTRCTVLLDTREAAHRGTGPESAFEWAVAAAASTATHLLERGLPVRLLTDTGTSVPGPEGTAAGPGGTDPGEAAGLLLDVLAVVEPSGQPDLSAAYEALHGEGLLIGFFGELDEAAIEAAARMRQRSAAAVAFVLDGDAWAQHSWQARSGARPGRLDDRLRMLREVGWTALPVTPGASLPTLWRAADGAGGIPSEGPWAGAAATPYAPADPDGAAAGAGSGT
ncbi:DUF58 domain-containing protein [Streptomyces catenulae]|uniref:DUF58 domain-containing protein n=1 Tax=Streptomyces catenulae TaxID=66875 RepID=A0ABV2Z382_9ACTN|nr:DUF58 domain-containing protein [Streptomyces catenulae]